MTRRPTYGPSSLRHLKKQKAMRAKVEMITAILSFIARSSDSFFSEVLRALLSGDDEWSSETVGTGDLSGQFIDAEYAAFLAPIQESQEHIVPLLHAPLSGVVHPQMFQKALFENAGIRRFCI
jgi:hypothetical protein